MTDQPDQIEHAGHTSIPSSTLSLVAVGRLLVEAREKMGLSVDEVGNRLRLTSRQVEAMESGNIDALPGPAFVRGFLRNYAKLLQIDAEPLLEACRAHSPESAPKQISLHSENIQIAGRDRKGWTVYLAATMIVVLVLAAWFAYMDFSEIETRPAQPVDAAIPHEIPETAIQPQPVQPLPEPATTGELPAAGEPAGAVVPAAEAAVPDAAPVAVQPLPAVAQATLVLTSSQTSWVSVTDRDGKEIFSRNVVAGSSESLSGNPPLKLVIGNATGMQVTFNGNKVDIAPHIRSNVARLNLE